MHHYDQYATSWSLLYNLLRDAFPVLNFHAGRNVTSIVPSRDGAAAILDDGTRFEGDRLTTKSEIHLKASEKQCCF